MSESLQGKVVLVVGASSGIGQATAELAAREGAVVVAAARREDRLIAMKQQLASEGITLHTRKADVTSLEEMQSMVDDVEKNIGNIAIAVYASGTNTPQRAMKVMPPAVWNEVLEVNLTGAFHLAHAVLPGMRSAGTGQIVFVSSTAGAIADLSGAAYQASKRGVLGLAHAIRLEERMNGIRTCCIMPGLTNTELVDKRPEKLSADTLEKALQPQDVAETIVHVMKTPAHVTITELLMVPSQA